MNAASPDRTPATKPELPDHHGSPGTSRGLLLCIMLVLLLWGIYLARGAFLLRHNFWQGALVLICVVVYLCFWGGMIAERRARLAHTNGDTSETGYSRTCVAGFAISLLGFALALISLLIARSDLSDGLAGDLRHLLQASKVGAELHSASIPISRAARLRSRAEGAEKTPLLAALTDGEDFELLFTVASRDAVPLLDGWRKQFPDLNLTCVGKIMDPPGLQIRDEKGIKPLGAHGYQHFE